MGEQDLKTDILIPEFMLINDTRPHLFAVCSPGNSRPELGAFFSSLFTFFFLQVASLGIWEELENGTNDGAYE